MHGQTFVFIFTIEMLLLWWKYPNCSVYLDLITPCGNNVTDTRYHFTGKVPCGRSCQANKDICYQAILGQKRSIVQYKMHKPGTNIRSSFKQPSQTVIGVFDASKVSGNWIYKCNQNKQWKNFPAKEECKPGRVFTLSTDCLVR